MTESINFVKEETGAKSISVITYLEGSTAMLAALAEGQHELHAKVNLFIALGPILELRNTQTAVFQSLIGGDGIDQLQWWLDYYNIHEMYGPAWDAESSGFCFFQKDFCDQSEELIKLNARPKLFPAE